MCMAVYSHMIHVNCVIQAIVYPTTNIFVIYTYDFCYHLEGQNDIFSQSCVCYVNKHSYSALGLIISVAVIAKLNHSHITLIHRT